MFSKGILVSATSHHASMPCASFLTVSLWNETFPLVSLGRMTPPKEDARKGWGQGEPWQLISELLATGIPTELS